ncbi:leucine-rich repeat-containing protein 3B-like [Nyctibius grandis]|uniref:leucine-rich repeat-containing protein 3B-like n=1 Tax=Nyctibius grandis TaxID=48427 RepID=UPI0035BC257C
MAVLVAVGGWLGAILVYVGHYVRRSRAETRLHLEYLRALPCEAPSPEEEEEEGEEETLSTIIEAPCSTSSKAGSPEGVKPPQMCPSSWSRFTPSYF